MGHTYERSLPSLAAEGEQGEVGEQEGGATEGAGHSGDLSALLTDALGGVEFDVLGVMLDCRSICWREANWKCWGYRRSLVETSWVWRLSRCLVDRSRGLSSNEPVSFLELFWALESPFFLDLSNKVSLNTNLKLKWFSVYLSLDSPRYRFVYWAVSGLRNIVVNTFYWGGVIWACTPHTRRWYRERPAQGRRWTLVLSEMKTNVQ